MNQEYIGFSEFKTELIDKLKTPSCLPACIEELCGGWSQETFKQIVQKMTKKGSTPLPLWFDSFNSMDALSNKTAALEGTFRLLDTKKLGRIDSTELFSAIILMATGDLENIIEIYGFEKPNSISQSELYFFLDMMFRGLCKILIKQGQVKPSYADKKLAHEELCWLVKCLFKDLNINFLMKDELIKNLKEIPEIYNFFNKTQLILQESLIYARDQSLTALKNMIEIKKTLIEMITTIEKQFNEKKQYQKIWRY